MERMLHLERMFHMMQIKLHHNHYLNAASTPLGRRKRDIIMKNLWKALFAGSVIAALAVTASVPAAAAEPPVRQDIVDTQLPAFKELVRVTPDDVVGGTSSSDHVLTFGSPFQLPGLSLAPGTYVFGLDRANQTLRVTNTERKPLAWLQTVPMTRATVTGEYAASFGEPVSAGAPRPLTSWFLPNQSDGFELVYQP